MQLFITPEQYLAKEVNALEKHEYFAGTVIQIPSKTVLECEMIANTLLGIGNGRNNKNYQIFLGGLRIYIQKIVHLLILIWPFIEILLQLITAEMMLPQIQRLSSIFCRLTHIL